MLICEYQGVGQLEKEINMKDYQESSVREKVSIGESVRIIRELQELNQNQLSTLSGTPQSTLSAIEHDKVNLGVERAKVLARALQVHPSLSKS